MKTECPNCHVNVKPTDYFCYNCGNNLKPTPPSINLVDQIMLYVKSLLLPPFGILWAIKYLKQNDEKSKFVGVVAIVITVISFIFTIVIFNSFVKNLNSQMNSQLDSFQY